MFVLSFQFRLLLSLRYYWFVSFLFAILVCNTFGLFFNLRTCQGDIGFLTMALAEAVAERCGLLKVAAQAAMLPLCRRQISSVTQGKHIVLTWLLVVYSVVYIALLSADVRVVCPPCKVC